MKIKIGTAQILVAISPVLYSQSKTLSVICLIMGIAASIVEFLIDFNLEKKAEKRTNNAIADFIEALSDQALLSAVTSQTGDKIEH